MCKQSIKYLVEAVLSTLVVNFSVVVAKFVVTLIVFVSGSVVSFSFVQKCVVAMILFVVTAVKFTLVIPLQENSRC